HPKSGHFSRSWSSSFIFRSPGPGRLDTSPAYRRSRRRPPAPASWSGPARGTRKTKPRGDPPVKIRSRLAALGGVVVAGALALTACGSDDNPTTSPGSAPSGAIDCATGSINAAGSSAQKNAIEEWTKVYAAECAGANLNYNPSGSGAGIQAFTSGQVAFAGSDSALDEEE